MINQPNISGRGDSLEFNDLGRHPVWRAHAFHSIHLVHGPTDTEIRQLELAFLGGEDVCAFAKQAYVVSRVSNSPKTRADDDDNDDK